MSHTLKGVLKQDSSSSHLWASHYAELQKFHFAYGHIKIPVRNIKYKKLSTWLVRQRFNRHNLTNKQILDLEKLGFVWCPRDDVWEEQYHKLCEFYNQYKNYNIPISYSTDPVFGRWVRRQRALKEEMLESRRQKLDAINFSWDVREDIWKIYYIRVRKHVNEHQMAPSYSSDIELYNWIKRQKQKYNQGKLCKEKINLLRLLDIQFQKLNV